MNTEYIFPMIYEFSIFTAAIIESLFIGKKYRERKTKTVKYMFLFSFLLCMAVLIAAISRILRLTNLWKTIIPGETVELLAITVSFIGFGNLFLLAFVLEVFYGGALADKNKKYLIIYFIISVIAAIYYISAGILVEDLTDVIWLILIGLSFIVYIFLIRSAWSLSRKIESNLPRISTQIIGLSGVSIMSVMISFMIDAALGGAFTPFYYIAWVFVVISIILLYASVLQPPWYKKWVDKRGIKNGYFS